jgi:hypothetical protein
MSSWSRWQIPVGRFLCAVTFAGQISLGVGVAVPGGESIALIVWQVVPSAEQNALDTDLHAHPDAYERLDWNNAAYSATGQRLAAVELLPTGLTHPVLSGVPHDHQFRV